MVQVWVTGLLQIAPTGRGDFLEKILRHGVTPKSGAARVGSFGDLEIAAPSERLL